jgi:hypothetical protein
MMTELGRLYYGRMWGRPVTVQATSRDHSGTIHCRVYSPGTDWHGICCQFAPEGLKKLDLPVPPDGWETVKIVLPGEALDVQ